MSSKATPIDVVCAIIEDEKSRILVAQRPKGKHAEGKWEFPGGKIERGESEPEALKRELEEELGITVEVLSKLKAVVHDYRDFSIRLLPYRAKLTTGPPVAREHEAIRWIDLASLSDLDWAAADLPIVSELLGG